MSLVMFGDLLAPPRQLFQRPAPLDTAYLPRISAMGLLTVPKFT